MDMNNKLLHDKDTNVVFFSPWLKDEKEGHPDFCQHLKKLLNEMEIESKELKSTNDYWARDYMPIQLAENEFLKYRYYPDYLVNKNDFRICKISDNECHFVTEGLTRRKSNLTNLYKSHKPFHIFQHRFV